MYIPSFNTFGNPHEVIAFMQRYSFATIITAVDNIPEATHLPFLVKEEGDKLILLSHFAKANKHSLIITDKISLVIFTEPHAYISPSHYEKQESVPTWNYIAVHAYGNAVIIDDENEKALLLEHTINSYEAAYLQQWNSLSAGYRSKMMNGIVAFKMEVTGMQAKSKLSQNRTATEQENIINSLQNSTDNSEREIAAYMQRFKK